MVPLLLSVSERMGDGREMGEVGHLDWNHNSWGGRITRATLDLLDARIFRCLQYPWTSISSTISTLPLPIRLLLANHVPPD
jgi:hypothetical protein